MPPPDAVDRLVGDPQLLVSRARGAGRPPSAPARPPGRAAWGRAAPAGRGRAPWRGTSRPRRRRSACPPAVPAAPTATPTLALTRRRTPSTLERLQEGAEHAGGDPGGVGLVGDPLAEHGEAAAEAGDGVARAQHLFQARAGGAQDRVAASVAERLVEDLQAVEVDAQQRDAPGAAAQAGERAGRAVLEQDAVRQAGQRVAVQARAGRRARMWPSAVRKSASAAVSSRSADRAQVRRRRAPGNPAPRRRTCGRLRSAPAAACARTRACPAVRRQPSSDLPPFGCRQRCSNTMNALDGTLTHLDAAGNARMVDVMREDRDLALGARPRRGAHVARGRGAASRPATRRRATSRPSPGSPRSRPPSAPTS